MLLTSWLCARRTARSRQKFARGRSSRRVIRPVAAVESLEDRTLLTAYVVDTLDDAVAADGKVSLREAVQAANTNAAVNEAAAGQAAGVTDSITFNAALVGGTITLRGTRLDVTGALSIAGLGSSQLTISGNRLSQVFAVAAGANLSMSNLKLTQGFASNASFDTWDGGAVFVEGTLNLTDVVLSDSTASFRGAILYNEGTVLMTGGTVREGAGDAAIENHGTLTAIGTVFVDNDDTAIGNQGTLTLEGCLFENNEASSGAAIDTFGFSSFVTVRRSTFRNNHAVLSGGAISNFGESFRIFDSTFTGNSANSGGAIDNFSSDLEITGSTFFANQATVFHGGAIDNSSGDVRISNSTISGNEAGWYGGGVYTFSGSLTLRNVTVFGNRVNVDGDGFEDGAGIYQSGSSIISLYNTIVVGNVMGPGGVGEDIFGTVSGRNNLIGTAGASGGLTNGVNGNIVGATAAAVLDPVLKNNGGPTLTHGLVAGSRAVNAGSNADALDAGSPATALATDQRGAGFSRIITGVVDIGAVEAGKPASIVVDILADEDDGNYVVGDISLREAVKLVGDGGTVTFAAALTGGRITLGGSQITINRDVTISGLGASLITVDGNDASRVFRVGSGVTAAISGLTVSGGRITYEPGGGIENAGALTLTRVRVIDNYGIYGGGAANRAGATLTIRDSEFSGNSSQAGGGVWSEFSNASGVPSGVLIVSGSTFSGNASGGVGGAIASGGALHLSNSTLSGNTADSHGSGLVTFGGPAVLRNVTIFGNRADADGGGFSGYGGIATNSLTPITLFNTLVAGNTRGAVGAETPSDMLAIIDPASANNLIGDATSTGGLTNGVNGNVVGVDWRTVIDPVLRDNGGPTLTHALLPGGAAVDAGSNSQALDSDGNPLAFDQRGAGFPRVLRGTVDIGAFEQANAAPVAANDAFSINATTTLIGNVVSDSGNGPDSDPDGDSLTATAVNGDPTAVGRQITLASGALLTFLANGTFTYDTNGAFESLPGGQTTTDTFTYTISDGRGGEATATVTISVLGVNDPPVAAADSYEVDEDAAVQLDLLSNDSDPDGGALSVVIVTQPAHGTLTVPSGPHAPGTFVYTPDPNFHGTDTFTYRASDGGLTSDPVTVTITVHPVHDAPVAGNVALVTQAPDAIDGRVTATDVDDDSLVYSLSTPPTRGFVLVRGDGTFTYTPSAGSLGIDSFTVGVSDGHGGTTTATVTIDVEGPKADLVGFSFGNWWVGVSDGTKFTTQLWAKWVPYGWQQVGHGDFNGDGKTDVYGFRDGAWWIGLSNGSGYVTTRWAGWARGAWELATVGDLNGDGRDDILARRPGFGWWGALSTGSGFAAPSVWLRGELAPTGYELADVTGDGKADLVHRFTFGRNHGDRVFVAVSDGTRFSAAQDWLGRSNPVGLDTFLSGDFNGDGKQDLFRREGGNSLTVSLSTGSGFTTTQWATFSGEWTDVRVGDFNGDHRDDVAGRVEGAWNVFLSDGAQFTRSVWDFWVEGGWSDVQVADFDGDGRDDLAGRRHGNWWVALSTGASFTHSLWAQWRPAFQYIAAADATGQPRQQPAAPAAASPEGSASFSSADAALPARLLSEPSLVPVGAPVAPPADPEPLQLFWSQTDKDEKFAGALLAAV